MKDSDYITIYADGSCNVKTKIGGWACILKWCHFTKEFCGSAIDTTSQRMELVAAIEGLKRIKRIVPIVIKSDSSYLIKGASQWCEQWANNNWISKSSKQPIVNIDLWAIIMEFKKKYSITWQYIPEQGSLYIQKCHDMATSEMKKRLLEGRKSTISELAMF